MRALLVGFLIMTACNLSLANNPKSAVRNCPNNYQKIALTFDDGPWPDSTEKIVNILNKEKIKATFFVTARHIREYPDIFKAVVKNGYEIESHTVNHPMLARLSEKRQKEEMQKSCEIITQFGGKKPKFLRPPYMSYNRKTIRIADSVGLELVTWDIDPKDWSNGANSQSIYQNIVKHAHSGAIILLHDGGKNRQKTIKALPKIIHKLKAKGYTFVTLSELLNTKKED